MALTDHEMVDIHYNKMSSLQVNISAARLTRNNNNDDRDVRYPDFGVWVGRHVFPFLSLFFHVFPYLVMSSHRATQ